MESSPTARGFVDLRKIWIPGTEDKENEFKETFQYDRRMANHIQNERAIDSMKYNGPVELAKAICSLGNSYSGGFVFLGVADNGDIIGLKEDKKMGNFADYEDKFANHMRNKLESLLADKAFFADKIQIVFRTVGDKTICIIQVLPANKPLHVKIKSRDEFYARGPTARAQHMTGDDLIRYTMGEIPQLQLGEWYELGTLYHSPLFNRMREYFRDSRPDETIFLFVPYVKTGVLESLLEGIPNKMVIVTTWGAGGHPSRILRTVLVPILPKA